MKKLYDIPRREHQVDQIRRYASLGRRFVSLQNSVRTIDGTSKNPISTVVTCQKFGTASGEEMAQFFADFLQRVADDMVAPPVAAGIADVSPDRDILAEMTPGPFVHVGYDWGDKETSVEAIHYADGRILITNVKVIDRSADAGPESKPDVVKWGVLRECIDHQLEASAEYQSQYNLERFGQPDSRGMWKERALKAEATSATLTARNERLEAALRAVPIGNPVWLQINSALEASHD